MEKITETMLVVTCRIMEVKKSQAHSLGHTNGARPSCSKGDHVESLSQENQETTHETNTKRNDVSKVVENVQGVKAVGRESRMLVEDHSMSSALEIINQHPPDEGKEGSHVDVSVPKIVEEA